MAAHLHVLDPFLPRPDVRERHAIAVRAPADHVYAVACAFDLQSVPLINLIFRLRERFMGVPRAARRRETHLDIASLRRLGWGVLEERPGRLLVLGSACRPWQADVVFTPLDAEGFAAYREPGTVRIAWTIETEPVSHAASRLATETRVMASDAASRQRFLRYWSWARMGIVAIRWLLLPAIRREAEHRWRPT